jgi:hypothetical protein
MTPHQTRGKPTRQGTKTQLKSKAKPKTRPKTQQKPAAKSESKVFKKEEILAMYKKEKGFNLLLDMFLIFAFSISYGIYLTYTEGLIGVMFIVFALIACIIITLVHYVDMHEEYENVVKDLEILFK